MVKALPTSSLSSFSKYLSTMIIEHWQVDRSFCFLQGSLRGGLQFKFLTIEFTIYKKSVLYLVPQPNSDTHNISFNIFRTQKLTFHVMKLMLDVRQILYGHKLKNIYNTHPYHSYLRTQLIYRSALFKK